jgi:hypothetical protein
MLSNLRLSGVVVGDDSEREDAVGRCELCGGAKDGARCPACDPEKPLGERVADALAYVRGQIESGKRHGADLSKAEEKLTGAKFFFDAGSFEDAQQLVGEAGEMAGDILIQYEALMSAMRRSAKTIRDAKEAGDDTSEADRYLELAQEAKRRTEYKLGITYAVKSDETAGKKKPKTEGSGGWQSSL